MLDSITKWLHTAGPTIWFILKILFGAASGILGLFLLTLVPTKARKYLVMAITFICGLYFSVEFLYPKESFLTKWTPALSDLQLVIGSFTVLLGIGNLFQIHGKTLRKLSPNWPNALAFFVGFFSILIAGLLKDILGKGAGAQTSSMIFDILFQGFLVSLQSTMFSLVAFYIVSASYRAFRIKSAEAGLMMAAAVIIMLAMVPLGAVITDWIPQNTWVAFFRLERLGPWILATPNMAVQRAIGFGIAVGSLAMGLRIWLSLEKGSFFDKQL